MDSYPDSIGSEDEVCHGSSSFSLQPDFSQSPRMDPATENIRNVQAQVQACIDSTSMQLKNDYQHRAAVYQAWCPPTWERHRLPNTSPIIQPHQPGSIGNSPRGSVGNLWGLGQQPGYLQQQQQQFQEGSQGSLNAGSFSAFFKSRRSGSASNLDAPRPSPMPFIQALVQDVRASREAAGGRPVSPLQLKRLLDAKATTPLLLEKLRQHSMQQEGSAQQGLNISNSSPIRGQGSFGAQNSAASVMTFNAAAGVPGVLSAGRGSSSLGELSLWGEPLNVSPVSPHRGAAAPGSPSGMSGRTEGSFLTQQQQQQARPQSPTVLAMLATEHNIAPPVVLGAGLDGWGADEGAYAMRGSRGDSPDAKACCRTRSCSPVAYRSAAADVGPAGRSRSCSPQHRHLICCGCRRQHTLQQHSKCCHQCGSCCKGTCGGKGSIGGSIIGSGCAAAGSRGASGSGMQGSITAEPSEVSSTSTCPCVKAYRKGHRDALQETGSPVRPSTAGAAMPAVQAQRSSARLLRPGQQQHQDMQQQPQDMQDHYLPSSSQAGAASYGGSRSTDGAAAVQRSGYSAADLPACDEGPAAPAPVAEPAPGNADDLVQTAFLEVFAAQQNLLAQGPAADPQDIEELTQILQQVLPAAEPQHEQLLKDVLGRQQKLLAMQETYLADIEAEAGVPWSQAPPLRLPSGLGKGRSSAGPPAASAANLNPQQQHQGASSDADGFSTRAGSTSSNITSSSAGPRAVYVTQQDLQGHMSKEDRLAAAAAAYEAVDSGQKPLQQVLEAVRGTAGSRSSRGRWTSGASTVDAHTGYPAAGPQQHLPRRAQDYLPAMAQQQQGGPGFDNDGAPAYTPDGSDLELDHVRPLVHYMTAQGGCSRHVVRDSPTQVHDTRPPFDRASSTAGPGPGPVRAPSIADSAWSVQATPPASSNGMQQQVQCSPLIHAAMESEPWASSVGFTHAGAGASSRNGRHSSINSSSSAHHPAASLVEQVSAVVPPLNLGGALDTESAKLAGIAVDPRVMGLSPRLRDVDSLQELAAAMSMSSNGSDRRDSRGTDAGGVQGLSAGGIAPSPRTPGRPVLGATNVTAAAAGADQRDMCGRGTDASSSLSHRSVSVRLQRSSIGSEVCPSPGSLSSIAVGHVQQQQQQQQWSPMRQVQPAEQFKRTASARAGSFELPESNPTSQENSYKSLEELHEQADLAKSKQQATAAATAAATAVAKGPAAPSARASGPQQSLAGPQQGMAVQQRAPEMLSPRAIGLHNQLQQQHSQQLQHSHSNLSCASSLLDLAARARVLASGGGGSRHSAVAAMSPRLRSPFSPGSAMQSPKAGNLAAAAAAAAALSSGGGARLDKAASAAQSPRTVAQVPQAAVAAGSAGGGADHVQQQQQGGSASAASSAKAESSVSWRERQLAMQQELAAQQQQLSRMRSRASSVATTPVGASMLRSMSRASDFSTIASSMTGAATPRDIQQQQQQQQQQAPQQPQQQQQVAQQQHQQHTAAGAGHNSHHQQQQQPAGSTSDDGTFDSMVDSVLGDALQQRREARVQKQALQGWRQYSAARKARSSSKHTEPASCQSPTIKQSPQQQQTLADDQQQHNQQRPGSGHALRISLQGLNRAVLKQSLGQLLQGQLQDGSKAKADSENDSLEIVVSGQLRLSSPPRQRSPSPGPHHRPHSASAGSSVSHASGSSSSNETIRRFEEQLEATRAAVTAAAATAGRAPLQGVLRDMHSMISRMEAVCTNSWQEGAAAAGAAAGASPQKASGQQGHRQSAQQYLQQKGASAAGRSRSPAPNMASQRLHASPWRPGSAGSMSDWQQQTGAGSPQPCAQAYNRSRSPRRQPAPASPAKVPLRSPDKHKLRGRLRQVQDRLAKLEIKMNQASAMTEPCSCNAAGCVHRLSSPRGSCAYGEQEYAGSGACCCSLQGKRDVLVGRMQQELEDLQQELCNMHTMMPGAYSSSGGC